MAPIFQAKRYDFSQSGNDSSKHLAHKKAIYWRGG